MKFKVARKTAVLVWNSCNYLAIPGTHSPPVSILSDDPAKSFPIG
jgi:hypothetical protein